MKKAFLCLVALATCLQAKLVVYGPQELIDKFNSASREADWSDIDPKGNAFEFDRAAWSRLVYAFGDVGDLVHPRYESYGREMEAGRVLALPMADEGVLAPPKTPDGPLTPPLDYAPDED